MFKKGDKVKIIGKSRVYHSLMIGSIGIVVRDVTCDYVDVLGITVRGDGTETIRQSVSIRDCVLVVSSYLDDNLFEVV